MVRHSSRIKGTFMVLFSCSLWGISGSMVQYLIQHHGFAPDWLVTIRLIFSGMILLSFSSAFGNKRSIWSIWQSKNERFPLLVYSIMGMLGVQYTFFVAIEKSNIATATLLQYLGPVFITVYLALLLRRLPSKAENIALVLALFGTFFLITNGNISKLNISAEAVFWGLSSAVFLAFYTIYPAKLIQRWGTMLVNGWGMLLGGITLSFIAPPWEMQGDISLESILLLVFIIVFGTAIPFSLYTYSTLYIKPNETSILASSEPLTAAIISVIWLQVSFGLFEWVGSFCIILATIILSLQKEKRLKSQD